MSASGAASSASEQPPQTDSHIAMLVQQSLQACPPSRVPCALPARGHPVSAFSSGTSGKAPSPKAARPFKVAPESPRRPLGQSSSGVMSCPGGTASPRSASGLCSGGTGSSQGSSASRSDNLFAAISAWQEYRRYKEKRVLARGSFGTAVLLECPKSGQQVVSKQIYSQFFDDTSIKAVESEIQILSSLAHPHVVQYLGAYHKQEPPAALCIVTAFAEGGTLERAIASQLKEKRGSGGAPPSFPRERVLTWVVQLVAALAHVHEQRILHRDLKSSNVYLAANQDIRLGDFGLSRTFGSTSHLASTVCGTPYYLSPEQVHGNPYGTPADLWALGVVIFELLTLRRPFEAPNLAALALRISSAQCLDEQQLAGVAAEHPAGLRALVGRNRNLFTLNSRTRMRMAELVDHLMPLVKGSGANEDVLIAAQDSARAASWDHSDSGSACNSCSSDTLSESGGWLESRLGHVEIPPGAKLARIPDEVPELPASFQPRDELMRQLKDQLLGRSSEGKGGVPFMSINAAPRRSSSSHTTATTGMGGVGKTLSAAELCRDPEVGLAFETICWASVGQEPDLLQLQNVLHRQITGRYLPNSAIDAALGLDSLVRAAKGKKILLVLDDVWHAEHAKMLACVDPEASSRSVVTTRIRALVPGAAEVQCDLLTKQQALALLLREGGCEHMLERPPNAAREAIELCGRLPLALGIAGGIMAELADSWDELVVLLREELGEATVEERVVTASLRVVPPTMREGVEQLFELLAVFPEDCSVPVAAIDAIASPSSTLLRAGGAGDGDGGGGGTPSASKMRLQLRRWVQQLLKLNVVHGSMQGGIRVHDLVRDCMTRRATATHPGGLESMQREVVRLLLDAFDAKGPAAGYVSGYLHWHVYEAHGGTMDKHRGMPIHRDALLMEVLGHDDEAIRIQAARGLSNALPAAVEACRAGGLWFEAAQLLWAASSGRGGAASAELMQADVALQQLEANGGGTAASERLELRVLTTLALLTTGGYAKGSDEYHAMTERLAALSKGVADRYPAAIGEATACFMGPQGFYNLEGGFSKPELVHTSNELLERAHAQVLKFLAFLDEAAAVAPSEAHWVTARGWALFHGIAMSRQHRLPGFSWERRAPSREALLEVVMKSDVAAHHTVAKGVGAKVDFMLFAPHMNVLLLRFGDIDAVQAHCMPKLLAGWRHVASMVRRGEAEWKSYFFETLFMRAPGLVAPLLLSDADALAQLQDCTLHGVATRDESARHAFLQMHGGSRAPDAEGYCMYMPETHLLHVRCIAALLEPDSEEARASLAEWLPRPEQLVAIARLERHWDIYMCGPAHPSLLAARLHGTRLGDWQAAAAVARGLLGVRVDVPMHPLLRIESLRLLARATTDAREGWVALEQAVQEAAEVGYAWMEVVCLREMLGVRGAPPKDVEEVRQQLEEALGRIVASRADVESVLRRQISLQL